MLQAAAKSRRLVSLSDIFLSQRRRATGERERVSARLELRGLDEHMRQLTHKPRLVGSPAWMDAETDAALTPNAGLLQSLNLCFIRHKMFTARCCHSAAPRRPRV